MQYVFGTREPTNLAEDMYIAVSSYQSLEYYPYNTSYEFRNHIFKTLNLSANSHEIGLSEIYYYDDYDPESKKILSRLHQKKKYQTFKI